MNEIAAIVRGVLCALGAAVWIAVYVAVALSFLW